jgi:Mg2+-importing ATPase
MDMANGLTQQEADLRLEQYGRNEIAQRRKLSGLVDFLLRFKNPLIFILLVAACISAFFGDSTSASIIVVIVFISVLLDFVNTHKSEQAAEALKNRVQINTTVVRDGISHELPLSMVVPGDLILLTSGNIIPADGKVVEAKDFFLNESSLTGESFPGEKVIDNAVYMGTSVVTGYGKMVVTQTGASTKFGKIAQTLTAQQQPTDFDRGISSFSYLIMRITFVLIIFVFFINAFLKHDILQSFLFAAALAVGLTPELLPMIIAINLSKGSIIMAKNGVIVKKLSAIQTFGSMDVLCTDKTGTLTEDRIVLIKCIDEYGEPNDDVFHYSYLTSIYHSGFENPLDTAIKDFKKIDTADYVKIDEIPFDFERRCSSVVVERSDAAGGAKKRILISKGAPEAILAITSEAHNKTAIDQYENLSKAGFRVLALSIKTLPVEDQKKVYSKDDETEMQFVGFIAFLDPPKADVSETIKNLEDHNIKIKILTGDSELVSQKIAADINLALDGTLVGDDIENMTDEILHEKVEATTLFARLNPEQKVRVIKALRKNGHVVGYLGDGINDAPSLRAADVGVSVNNAVDVAKDSADLILLEKSLDDLIRGVVEGRKIFSNTLKYLMMALSSNFGNMFSMAGASMLLPFLPMLPVQVLLNNLLYDSSQFTIPLDNVDAEDIVRPRKLNISFIKRFMVIFGLLSSVFDFITFGVLFFVFHLTAGAFQTGWFLESIATQILVIYIIRTRKVAFFQSLPSRPVVFSTLLVLAIAIYFAFGSLATLFKFDPLSLPLIMIIGLIVVMYLLCTEAVKRWFYRKVILSLKEY